MRIYFLLLSLLVLAACQTRVEKPHPAIVSNNANEALTNPAVIQLWKEAEALRKQHQYARAEKRIEQALTILPEKAILWSKMAELAMLQKMADRAEDFAQRSNAFAGRNLRLLKRNWMIIRYSRLQRGDKLGAKQAELKIQKLAHYD